MMEVRHVGIVVSNMAAALSFYRDLLGMKVVRDMHESGPHMDELLDLPDVDVHTVKLQVGTGPTLVELLAFTSPESALGQVEICDLGPSHLALTVTDLDALGRRLERAHVKFRSEPILSADGKARVCFCADPDGTPIELVEMQA